MQEAIILSFLTATSIAVLAVVGYMRSLKRRIRRHCIRYEAIEKYYREED